MSTERLGDSAPGSRDEVFRLPTRAPDLTGSEARVLELAAAGLSTQQIASELYLSKKAVEYHVHHLLLKFATRNRAGMIARAFLLGFFLPKRWPPCVFAGYPASAKKQDQVGGLALLTRIE